MAIAQRKTPAKDNTYKSDHKSLPAESQYHQHLLPQVPCTLLKCAAVSRSDSETESFLAKPG